MAAGRNRPRRFAFSTVTGVLAIVAGLSIVPACGDDAPAPEGARTLDVDGMPIHAVVREPEGSAEASLTVLFLHGASYTSRIWADREVLDGVVDAGHRAVAIDLPGSGASPDVDAAPPETLASIVEHVGPPGNVVLVSPSMSGRFSLAMLTEGLDVRLAGFVAVAPAGIQEFDLPSGSTPPPALLVWGEDDDVIPVAQAEQLRSELPGSELVVVPDGSHAPYDDEPAAFTEILLEFLATLDPGGP